MTAVYNKRIFDSPTIMWNKKKLWYKFVAHIFMLLLAPFVAKLVNSSRHSESLENAWISTNRWFRWKISSISNSSVTNVGLTDLIRFFLVTPRGRTLHQIVPPPSSLTRNPVYCRYSRKTQPARFAFPPCISSKKIGHEIHLKLVKKRWFLDIVTTLIKS